jgi:hypothetical protein
MGSRMKITLDLEDELVIAAKKRAAEERSSLKAIVERGLRAELKRPRGRSGSRKVIRWVTVDGGLAVDFDASAREGMHAWLRRRA